MYEISLPILNVTYWTFNKPVTFKLPYEDKHL